MADFKLDDENIAADVAQTVARMPEVSEHFEPPQSANKTVGEIEQEQAAAPLSSPGRDIVGREVDASGEIWDAAKHSASKAKNAQGLWRKKRQSKVATGATVPTVQTGPTNDQLAQAKANATVISQCIFMLGSAVGGSEWKPEPEEVTNMENAWTALCVARQWYVVRPEVLPLIAVGAYVGKRMTMPITQTKMQRLRAWIVGKYANWLDRRAQRKNPNAPKKEGPASGTHHNSGNDTKR